MKTTFDKGSVIAGRYRVRGVLALRATTAVYEVDHFSLRRPFALKLVHFPRSAPELRQQFAHEALQLMRVRNPHVQRPLDVGIEGEFAFVATELLEGGNLAQELAVRGPLPIDEAATFVLHAVLGVRAVLDAGLVHRSPTTENLFVAHVHGELLVKLFGLGLVGGGQDRSDTLAYLAPERIRHGTALDVRGAVWTLGVILYELLSGAQPFLRERRSATRRAVLLTEPERLDQVREDVPSGLAEVVSLALSKRPEDRYDSIETLAVELLAFARPGLVIRAPPRISLIRELDSGAGERTPTTTPDGTRSARR